MFLRDEFNAQAFVGALSTEYDCQISVVPMPDAAFKDLVGDATLKFRARLPDGRSGFLLVSGPGNPRLVGRAVNNIRTARANVSAEVAEPILPPILAGEIEQRDFAIWPELRPFCSANRLRNFIVRQCYSGPILSWSAGIAAETLRPGDPGRFLADLQVIADDEAFPRTMRSDAAAAAERIASGAWRPKSCLHHGDFWTGNILLSASPRRPDFSVIDWAGMERDGYPFLDLTRMLRSLRASTSVQVQHIENLRRVVGCERHDVPAYLLSALGHVGRNLEYFPVDRYRAMAIQAYASLTGIAAADR